MDPGAGDGRHPGDPGSTPAPQALRTRWRPADPLQGASAYGVTVRVVVADRAIGGAVCAALAAQGADLAPDGATTRALVVVDTATGPADTAPDLRGFWEQLRSYAATIPPQGRVVWVEHRSATVDEADRALLDPEAAARAFAVRAAAAENRFTVAVLDLDPADPVEIRAWQIAAEFAALRPGADTVVAYRRGVRYVPTPLPALPGPPADLTGDGYHLVTGGLGAVGRRLVTHLVTRGARRIGIVGRSPVDGAAEGFLRGLHPAAEVDYHRCDVADQAALTAAAASFARRWGRLRGIVHCSGGVNQFGSLRRRQWSEAARVTAPKVAGSRNVIRLARTRGRRPRRPGLLDRRHPARRRPWPGGLRPGQRVPVGAGRADRRRRPDGDRARLAELVRHRHGGGRVLLRRALDHPRPGVGRLRRVPAHRGCRGVPRQRRTAADHRLRATAGGGSPARTDGGPRARPGFAHRRRQRGGRAVVGR